MSETNVRRSHELLGKIESLILAEGFSQLRIGALAAHLRCSRSTLYKLAPSKDELIALVFQRYLDGALAEAKAEAEPIADQAERITRFLDVIGRWQAKGSDTFWRDVRDHPEASEVLSEMRAQGYRTIQGYLDEGIAAGRFRPANTAFIGYIIWHDYRTARDSDIVRRFGLTSAEAVREVGRLILYGMSPVPIASEGGADSP
jgi:AcrR family transcriptional regulator